MPQKLCIHCKRIFSIDGSWKEYCETSPESASLGIKSTICPDCTYEKYPKFYDIHHSPTRRKYLNTIKLVSKPLSSIKRLVQ
jgi:hypothetical protein